MQLFYSGILIGMGAAIPIGPINLEIMRRNLRFGTPYGVVTGLGACGADITYLILLCLGALTLVNYPDLLRLMGLIGSLILAWFGISALRNQASEKMFAPVQPSLWRYSIEGYFMTLINPYTILFWASISSQISLAAFHNQQAMLLAGMGVMLSTVGWVLFLNATIHVTRHRLSQTVVKWLNYAGGVILLSFAMSGLYKVFF